MSFMVRQGDVMIVEVDQIPTDVKTVDRDNGRIVLAYGEVTGHAHAIPSKRASLVEAKDGSRFLKVLSGGVTLFHEEHKKIDLPPGLFRVIRQREFFPNDIRTVAD